MIEFLAHMPTDTKIFLTMAVLGLAGTHPVKAAETVIGSDFDCD
jgi:hypothetical protein